MSLLMSWPTQRSLLMNWPQWRNLMKNQPLWRSLLLNCLLWWPMSGSQLRIQTPPMQCEKGEKRKVPCSNFPGWMQVLHPAQPVTPTGLIPLTLGKLMWHCCSQSSGGRRARHQWTNESERVMEEMSDLTSSWGSPKPRPEVAPPPGFKKVAACLMRDSPSLAPIEAPLETRLPDVMAGPVVATMYSTRIVWEEATGAMYMDKVTTLVGRVTLGNPCMVANIQRPTVEDITNLT